MAIITLPLPNIFANGTTADANQVNADLNQITANVNANAAALAAPAFTGGIGVTGGTVTDTLTVSGASTLHATSATSIDSSPIGQTTPAAGKFTTLVATTSATLPAAVISGASTIASTAQPAFTAYSSTNIISGSGASSVPVIFPTVGTQQGGTNYSVSTGKFTAPDTGWYLFTAQLTLTNSTGSNQILGVNISVGGATLQTSLYPAVSNLQPTGSSACYCISQIAYMTAGQTAFIYTNTALSGTLYSQSGQGFSFFSGAQLF